MAAATASPPELILKGQLVGHNGWVTQIATNNRYPDLLLSSSRDKSLMIWKLLREESNYGVPQKRLKGHGHFITDVTLSSDGQYALSGSWDKTLRLWDLNQGKSTRRFEDHTKDVMSVAFSVDNRQIISGSRDRTIKLWNTLAQCKYTITEDGHQDWVSCVRFSPTNANPMIVSAGWDKSVKVSFSFETGNVLIILNFVMISCTHSEARVDLFCKYDYYCLIFCHKLDNSKLTFSPFRFGILQTAD